MSLRRTHASLVSLLVALIFAAAPCAREASAQGVRYTVTDLGQFMPSAVNEAGQVAGSAIIGGRGIAVYYDGSLKEITPPGGAGATASGLNNRGQVVGSVLLCDTVGLVCQGSHGRAFVYHNGVFTLLGTLGGRDSVSSDIDDAGRAVGYSFLPGPAPDISSGEQAFSSAGGPLENLGAKMGVDGSKAWAASASGLIAGNFVIGRFDSGMFLYDSRDGTFSLIRLVGLPSDVNDLGHIVGHYGGNDDGSGHAFSYSGGAQKDLGKLLPSHTFSRAWAVNNAGQIVGVSSESFFNQRDERAFVYEGGVMRDLNALIAPNSGWVLHEAKDINAHGQIVGRGTLNGQPRAFMLTPVEPLLSVEAGTDRAVALDSVTFLRDPLAPTTAHNFSTDGRTRLVIIARNVETFAGENVQPPAVRAEDAHGAQHALAVEHVGKVPRFPALTQIVVRLPDSLAGGGDYKLTVSFRGHTSNKAAVRIRPPVAPVAPVAR